MSGLIRATTIFGSECSRLERRVCNSNSHENDRRVYILML
jgi:hypothetical protein